MPERIQLRRTKGWRKPDGAVIVARPSKWGNPFPIGSTVTIAGVDFGGLMYQTSGLPMTREMSIAAYRDLVLGRMDPFGSTHPDDLAYVADWRAALEELRGRDLACWCPLDQPCHADVLLELANACPHGDPTCPCPDGLWCHYEDDPETGTAAEYCAHCEVSS